MKKVKHTALLIMLCTIIFTVTALPMQSVLAEEYPMPTYGSDAGEILPEYYNTDGRIMSCAHRGAWRNYPENSLESVKACVDMGVDMIELDARQTKDGVWIMSHDDNLKRMTNYTGSLKVSEMTYAETQKYYLREGNGGSTPLTKYKVGRFDDALKLCKGKIMINLDKVPLSLGYDALWDIYSLIRDEGCLDIVQFKSDTKPENIKYWFDDLKARGADTMPVYSLLLSKGTSLNDAKYIVDQCVSKKLATTIETSFSDGGNIGANKSFLTYATTGLRMFSNTMSENKCGGNTDDPSGWSNLINMGYSILQTDYISEMCVYLHSINSVRSADNVIDAENINAHSGVKISKADADLNRTLALSSAQYVKYSNIDFKDGFDLMAFNFIRCGNGTLSVYIDSMNSEPITTLEIGQAEKETVYSKTTAVSGVHDLYIRYLSRAHSECEIDSFSFSSFGDDSIVSSESLSIGLPYGKELVLPGSIIVITESGKRLSEKVVWDGFDKTKLEKVGSSFTVYGKTTVSGVYTSAKINILPSFAKDAIVWFDSSYGLNTQNGIVWKDRINGISAVSDVDTSPSVIKDENGFVSLMFNGKNDYMTFGYTDLNSLSDLSIITYSKADEDIYSLMPDYTINNAAKHTLLHFGEVSAWGSIWLSTFKSKIACRFGTCTTNNRGMLISYDIPDGFVMTSAVKSGMSEKIYLGDKCIYERADDTEHNKTYPYDKFTNGNSSEGWIGKGIQAGKYYYFSGSVSDIIILNSSASKETVNEVYSYLENKRLSENSGSITLSDYPMFVQCKKNTLSYTLRVLYTIDSSDYTRVMLNTSINGEKTSIETATLYEKVFGGEKTYTASQLGDKYIVAFTFDVKDGDNITVQKYLEKGDEQYIYPIYEIILDSITE